MTKPSAQLIRSAPGALGGSGELSAHLLPANDRRGNLSNTAKFTNPARGLSLPGRQNLRRKLRGLRASPSFSRSEINHYRDGHSNLQEVFRSSTKRNLTWSEWRGTKKVSA